MIWRQRQLLSPLDDPFAFVVVAAPPVLRPQRRPKVQQIHAFGSIPSHLPEGTLENASVLIRQLQTVGLMEVACATAAVLWAAALTLALLMSHAR